MRIIWYFAVGWLIGSFFSQQFGSSLQCSSECESQSISRLYKMFQL